MPNFNILNLESVFGTFVSPNGHSLMLVGVDSNGKVVFESEDEKFYHVSRCRAYEWLKAEFARRSSEHTFEPSAKEYPENLYCLHCGSSETDHN